MFIPLHGLKGYTLGTITASSQLVSVDTNSASLIHRRLGAGNHSYALWRTQAGAEVFRIDSIDGTTLALSRAIDGTTSLEVPALTNFEFVFAKQAVEDIVAEAHDVTILGSGIVTVTESTPNNFVVSAPEITIESASNNLIVEGSFPNFVFVWQPTPEACSTDVPSDGPPL